jgi:transcriptional regulator with XRE-family HTH domain
MSGSPESQKLGLRVSAVRIGRKLKRIELSRRSGIPNSTIRELEVNFRQIRPDGLARLADTLEVSIDFLLEREHTELPLPAGLSVQSLMKFLKAHPREDEKILYRMAVEANSAIAIADWQRLCELSDKRAVSAEASVRTLYKADPVNSRKPME